MEANTSFSLPVLETSRLFLLPWKLEYAGEMLLSTSNEYSPGEKKQSTKENKFGKIALH